MRKKNKNKKYIYIEPTPSYFHRSTFNLEIKDSNIANAGFGVFTKDFIPKDALIDGYFGDFMTFSNSKYYFCIKDGVGINAINYPRCYMAMINDAHQTTFTNNCRFEVDTNTNTVTVWSKVDIQPGEELLISYGKDYWDYK
jgi:hypothetical protein